MIEKQPFIQLKSGTRKLCMIQETEINLIEIRNKETLQDLIKNSVNREQDHEC